MAEKIFISVFQVESEAYQALSELKAHSVNDSYVISQAALVRNDRGIIRAQDGFDTGVETGNDAPIGGLIGGLIGILGGPIGMLLCGSWGFLAGSIKDSGDLEENVTLIEHASGQIMEGETAMAALVQERAEGSFEAKLGQWQTSTISMDAAEVAAEVESAEKLQREAQKETRKKMREEKKLAGRKKLEEQHEKLKAQFEEAVKMHGMDQ